MFIPETIPRAVDAFIASDVSSAVRRSLTAYEGGLTSTTSSFLQARGIFAPGSGPVDYFFAAIVFISIPATLIGHIMLYRSMNKRGCESLVGTPFAADEVERGFTFSQVASTLVSSARHLISFGGSKSTKRASVTESDFTNSNGFTASNFSIVNKVGVTSVNGNNQTGPILPVVAPQPPMNIALPAPVTISSLSSSAPAASLPSSAPVPRPTSPFSRPALFRSTNLKPAHSSALSSSGASGISVVTSTQMYQDRDGSSDDSMELSELGEIRRGKTGNGNA